jgi:hypothetical protein
MAATNAPACQPVADQRRGDALLLDQCAKNSLYFGRLSVVAGQPSPPNRYRGSETTLPVVARKRADVQPVAARGDLSFHLISRQRPVANHFIAAHQRACRVGIQPIYSISGEGNSAPTS